MKNTMSRSYSELIRLDSFSERYEYLALRGAVGESTFGFNRYINQGFYASTQWRQMRHQVIARDLGMDLGVEGYGINDSIVIHHMNPMTVDAIIEGDVDILDPEFLITTTHKTHNAIHYGDKSLLAVPLVERRRGDTQLW
jgi:hypothetical protein